MYLLTKSLTLNEGVSATLESDDAPEIIDGIIDDSVETSEREPEIVIDFGSGKIVDTVWLLGENLQDYDISASNDNSTFTSIDTDLETEDGEYGFEVFGNTTLYRYWKITLSQRGTSDPNYKISEVYLMRLLLDLRDDDKRPLRINSPINRDKVVTASTYNENLIEYKPSQSSPKTTITCHWEFLNNHIATALENIYKGPPHRPELTVYPRPETEPKKIYQDQIGFEFWFCYIFRD